MDFAEVGYSAHAFPESLFIRLDSLIGRAALIVRGSAVVCTRDAHGLGYYAWTPGKLSGACSTWLGRRL